MDIELVHERRGSGPPLVLFHGFAHRWQGWLPVMDRLAEEREVIAVDLPGFGANPRWPRHRAFTIKALVDDVEAFLAGAGLDHPHVAGNSLGGIVALELARRGAVASATALAPAAFMNLPSRLYVGAVVVGYQALARTVPFAVRNVVVVRPVINPLLMALAAHPSRFTDADWHALVHGVRHAPTLLLNAHRLWYVFPPCPDLDVPVTVAWGTRDLILWPRQVRLARRCLPRARFVPLPGCGHVPMYDNPDLVARVLLDGSSTTL
jgi:pimeloyl-ACP methyl ester carboxylesterase